MSAQETVYIDNGTPKSASEFLEEVLKKFRLRLWDNRHEKAPSPCLSKPSHHSTKKVREETLYIMKTRSHEDSILTQLATLEIQKACLEDTQARLKTVRRWLKDEVNKWEANRCFSLFLQLPIELRELVWKEYLHISKWADENHGPYERKFFGFGYSRPVALVCQQLRKEYIDWLFANEPVRFECMVQVWREPEESHIQLKLRDSSTQSLNWEWRSIPGSLLARIRHVRVNLFWDSFPSEKGSSVVWNLNLASGTMETRHQCSESAWPPRLKEIKDSRIQAVLDAIMEQGGLRRSHYKWFLEALAGSGGEEEMRAWLKPDEHLQHLPFANEDVS